MKFKLLALAVTSLISVNAMAVTIDYRHEMMDTPKADHKDRISMSHRFANGFGLSVEAKWRQSGSDTTPNKPYNETVSNGTEVVASYVYNFNKTFSLEPGFSLESNSTSNNYRPYLRGKVNITDDLSTSLRYRPYYKRNSGDVPNASRHNQENGYNLTAVVSYKFLKDFQVDYELDYKKANKAGQYQSDFETWKIDHDVKLAYKLDKNWKPYMAVGNVADSGTNDNRQTRYRVGVQYSF
ncbi:oligogalacturonate-specific porin KdgM family protein [Pectobacterium polaris]|uniref:Porin n=1 Tax=Pectobacterium polaris TaxID=2042057 RepID=A0AAW4P4X6_9GAMM|nr:oligogalacturonate-specific porin KdgM family protein [Pectobacterium polaris]MBW5894575.1 porin [Pectobacterium polaris]MDE8741385.1 oligogalacturonate-specific porin KdgM family protein [Pectobacterium polaris]MDE8755758.1 oligogalacturonate-specific porin KdgM family protein [Pectobacterium polaris]UAY90144.1 oligogalacturonate-specific porin KdgM family protein [Pectobacterium polaris]